MAGQLDQRGEGPEETEQQMKQEMVAPMDQTVIKQKEPEQQMAQEPKLKLHMEQRGEARTEPEQQMMQSCTVDRPGDATALQPCRGIGSSDKNSRKGAIKAQRM